MKDGYGAIAIIPRVPLRACVCEPGDGENIIPKLPQGPMKLR